VSSVYHISVLRSYIEERRARNGAYSLRTFAREMELSAGFLSKILSGQRKMSPKSAQVLAGNLGLGARQQTAFIQSAVLDENQTTDSFGPTAQNDSTRDVFLAHDAFRLVSEWYHGALLELFKLGDEMHNPARAAKALGLPIPLIRDAVTRLADLGLLGQPDGNAKPRFAHIEVASKRDEGIRIYHEQMLGKAIESLSKIPPSNRDITGFQMASSVEKIAEAKDRIRAFRKELQELLSTGKPDTVFACEIGLFPVVT
jgi:uncharacterized protein (TIGR02147 family)